MLFTLELILLCVPLSIFFVPLLILTLGGVWFWRRVTLRNTCIVFGLLIALMSIPFVAVRVSFRMDAKERLKWEFDMPVVSGRVAKYRFEPGGLDTVEFWKLKNANSDDYMQIVSKHSLTRISEDKLFPPASVAWGPWWWPRSTQGYLAFEGQDNEGGSREVWIAQDGSSVYLFRFLE